MSVGRPVDDVRGIHHLVPEGGGGVVHPDQRANRDSLCCEGDEPISQPQPLGGSVT
jgi:hypothetical protein